MHEDLCFQTVSELAKQIASRELSPVELTRAYLERTETLNEKVSVVITLTRELALERAAQAEREIRGGLVRGPLHGVPYGLKDLLDTKGIRTTGGSTIYEDRVPDRDSTVVERLNAAGGVLTCKLAMNEFASGSNNNNLIPQPRNPWKLDRSPAGSSSGSGASTAAAMVGFSMGSETGGSIMGPSAANGVCGMRPPYGRMSRYGNMTLAWSLDKLGPMAGSAEDMGLVLEAIAGHDPKDPTSSLTSAFKFRADPGTIAGRRIGVVRAEFEAVPPANRVVFATAVDVLKQAGFTLEDVTLPDRPYGEVYTCISNTEGGTNFKPLYDSGRMIQFYTPARRADWKAASMMPASDYLTALRIRAMIKMEADEVTSKYAVLIAPTSATGSGPIERRSDASGRAALPGDDRSVRKLTRMFHQSGDQGDLGSRNRIWEVWVRIGHVWSDSAVSMNASCCVFGFRRA